MLAQMLGGQGGGPSAPSTSPGSLPPPQGPSGPPWIPMLDQALSKMSNLGIPFASDISHMIMSGGGSPQTWGTLLKAIDAYGKHKQSVQAGNVPQPGQPAPQGPPPGAQPGMPSQGPMSPGMAQ